jgi:hypothetical protein
MQAGHTSRLRFERLTCYMMTSIVGVYAGIGLYSDQMADRVVKLAPSLASLAGTLGLILGASWARGHFDERLNSQNGQ